MKKLIYCALALAASLFATSCQQENLEPFGKGNTVTFTVQMPEVATKAAVVDNGKNINNLVYAVYRTDANDLAEAAATIDPKKLVYRFNENKSFTEEGNTNVTLELINNQKYIVLFWAQVDQTWVSGDTFDLTSISYPSDLTANDSKYAAFSGAAFVEEVKGARNEKVTLTRPFAQINLATSDPTNYSVAIDSSSVKIENVYSKFNVATMKAYGEFRTVEYAANARPDGDFGDYDYYVAMNYIFANPQNDGTTPVKVTCTIDTEEHGTGIVKEISNVPVAQNYRTNIVGNLLTSDVDYEVKLDNEWFTPDKVVEVVSVSTADELQGAIENIASGTEGNIKLEGEIDLSNLASLVSTKSDETTEPAHPAYGLQIPADRTLVLDLNGFTLSQTVSQTGHYSMIQNDGTLTIVDSKGKGKISYTDSGNGGEYVSNTIKNNGTMNIESGLIENNSSAAVASNGYPHPLDNNGVLTINGGTLTNNAHYSSMRIWCTTDDNTIVTINGGTFNGSIDFQTPSAAANRGTLTINGGTFNADTYTECTVRLLGFGADVDEMLGYINGGKFNGEIALRNWSGAEFNSQVFYITGGQFSVDPSAFVVDGYPVVAPETEGGYFTIGEYTTVATIGDQEYGSLRAAVDAVKDGGTITLVADETFTKANRYNNGGWWDGLGYSGDKSFTIDLGGHTIKQDGSLNDYLIWIKNDGEKANTITFKNGTMDAGTTAYSALATASSNAQKMTVNLENINLINNISNGAVVKARGGSELNVKAGTVITGMNSYVGIEAVGNNTVVNVYEGAQIYQKGTTSYVGAIIGASYNATLNIYGGKGNSAKCGIIVMSTGATINVSGGEWTANGDGTVATGNNGVLVSQNNRSESGWACKSVLNVTGGTFKGGYDCWGSGPGQEPDDAQINIKGGNFNANPANYVVAGYEATENAGTYTVDKPKALKELEAALANGGNVTLANDFTLLESIKVENKVVLDLNGKTITAPLFSAFEVKTGGELTVKNGKVIAYESTVRAIGGKVIIESGEYTSTGTALDSLATYRYSLDCREGGELIINGGTFKSNNGMINVGSTVTINGGKFENIVEKTMTRHFAYVSAPLTINDGEFYGKANSSAGGCFFCGAAAGGDIQINGGKFTSLWTSGSVNRIFEYYYGGTINVTGGLFNTNGGIATFVTENTDEATKAAYPYVAK